MDKDLEKDIERSKRELEKEKKLFITSIRKQIRSIPKFKGRYY